MSKKMDITFPSCEIYWSGSHKWYSSYKRNFLTPIFMATEQGTSVGFTGTAQDWDNEFMKQQWYLILISEEEIESLYNAINLDKIREALNQVSNTEDLFK